MHSVLAFPESLLPIRAIKSSVHGCIFVSEANHIGSQKFPEALAKTILQLQRHCILKGRCTLYPLSMVNRSHSLVFLLLAHHFFITIQGPLRHFVESFAERDRLWAVVDKHSSFPTRLLCLLDILLGADFNAHFYKYYTL
ncbi:hypothetical protein VCUG_01581 [Vavraia culicis subsp. floridensis]|uniref:Uncharacterized protein n=1 Tax=Vavraia culicis (isolate floridensis) TaxID=948595 RepID=L2GUD8_VAVCU|nr:uncharacterized protein VCUG_01581 [Vavraia culicis subsp. floridensis]ELA46962.1 hypothetical protein VCUG_01581 [Vavraia culicis subsp. floridensis]